MGTPSGRWRDERQAAHYRRPKIPSQPTSNSQQLQGGIPPMSQPQAPTACVRLLTEGQPSADASPVTSRHRQDREETQFTELALQETSSNGFVCRRNRLADTQRHDWSRCRLARIGATLDGGRDRCFRTWALRGCRAGGYRGRRRWVNRTVAGASASCRGMILVCRSKFFGKLGIRGQQIAKDAGSVLNHLRDFVGYIAIQWCPLDG